MGLIPTFLSLPSPASQADLRFGPALRTDKRCMRGMRCARKSTAWRRAFNLSHPDAGAVLYIGGRFLGGLLARA
jgi:hypothetical protein